MELSSEVNWSDASQKSEAQMHHLKVITVKHNDWQAFWSNWTRINSQLGFFLEFVNFKGPIDRIFWKHSQYLRITYLKKQQLLN